MPTTSKFILPLVFVVMCSCQSLRHTEPATKSAAVENPPNEKISVEKSAGTRRISDAAGQNTAKWITPQPQQAQQPQSRQSTERRPQAQHIVPASPPAPLAADYIPPVHSYPYGLEPCGPECGPDCEFGCFNENEFVCNGGDRQTAVIVKQDFSVHGLHPGDAVVHYDTLDGKTRVEPSNEVCLYAPRFASVRKIYGPIVSEQHDRPAGIEAPLTAVQSGDVGEPTTVVQPLQPGRRHAIAGAQQFRERNRGIGLENLQIPATAQDRFLPFEDLLLIRRGEFDNSEKARLAQRLQAAIVWTRNQGPQVAINNKAAQQVVSETNLESIYTYVVPPGKSRVRVCKIASKANAQPGDFVDFTLRFDNVGDQLIGNVTVLDRLHDRLEYVPDSQSCTLKADFMGEELQDGSPRVLRWEVKEPMKVGEGGIIRFRCQVR